MNICNNGCARKFMLHPAIFATKEKPPTEILYNNWRCNGGEIRQVIMGWVEPETYCTKPTEICSLYTEHCILGGRVYYSIVFFSFLFLHHFNILTTL